MPAMQTMLHALNHLTARDVINHLTEENFAPGCHLADRIRENLPEKDLASLGPVELDYNSLAAVAEALPPAIHDTIRELIRGAIGRNQGITFVWRPGYDFKLEISEALDTKKTYGGITVVLESRYPADPHFHHGPMLGG